MKSVKSPINVSVRSTSSTKDRSRTNRRGKERTRSVFTEDTNITDLDTGEVTTMRSKSVSRDGKEKRASTKFKVRDASGKIIMKDNTSYKQGGVITGGGMLTGVSPLVVLAQKISEMMKGEEEPLIIPRAPEPPPHIPPADSTDSSKQKDILTGLVVARLLQGRR